jgi:BA14K-like protein
MRSVKITAGAAALAFGSTLMVAQAFAQSPGRPLSDGGAYTDQNGNYVGTQSPPNAQGTAQNSEPSNCAARFHSFDPATGSYLGFDGRRHHCP